MEERQFYLKILGSFEIVGGGGERIRLPQGNARWILASLILEIPGGISEQRLIEQVWGPRGTSVAALRSAVSRLRGWIAAVGLDAALRIDYTGTGYQLGAQGVGLDAAGFKERFETAAGLKHEERYAVLLGAASLWRGAALSDAPPGLRHHPVTADLDHRRSQAAVELAHAARQVGRTDEILEILRRTAHDMPYDEPLQAAFLSAAIEAGLRTEAIRHFGVLSKRLATELGVTPSPDLLRAVRADRGAPSAAELLRTAGTSRIPVESARPGLGVEHGLPHPVVDFVGRGRELAAVRSALLDPHGRRMVYVMGPPGIGKSELCLKAAHELRAQTDVRVLYASLAGSGDFPAASYDVMRRFVQAMEPSGETAALEPHRLADRYQSLLARHATLIVLDDVAGAVQVRPLLPISDTSRVLINGRVRAPALSGVTTLQLCKLADAEGVSLLSMHLSEGRTSGAARMLEEMVGYLDGHPLALRTAGLRLAAHPHWDVAWMARSLRDPRTRLAELSHDGLSVRQLIGEAYGRLSAQSAATLLRLHQSAAATRTAGDDHLVIDIDSPAQATVIDDLVARWILAPHPGGCGRDGRCPAEAAGAGADGPAADGSAADGSGHGHRLSFRLSSLIDAFLTELGAVGVL